MTVTTTRGGACAFFYTHKEDNGLLNKSAKKCPKNKSLWKKGSANNQNEHVDKAKEHKVEALEVTKKVDHHKNIEKKGGYEGKIFKMDTKWVRSFPKRSQTTL